MVIKLKLILLIILIPMTCVFSQSGLGTIKGTVKDEVSKQPLPYSKVLLIQNGATKGAANRPMCTGIASLLKRIATVYAPIP